MPLTSTSRNNTIPNNRKVSSLTSFVESTGKRNTDRPLNITRVCFLITPKRYADAFLHPCDPQLTRDTVVAGLTERDLTGSWPGKRGKGEGTYRKE